MTDTIDPRKQEIEAIAAIAGTRDGALLHRYLRRVLETVVDFQEPCALYGHNGRRSLARDLMQHMAERIDAGRTDPSDAPILARAGSPAAVSASGRRDPARFPRVDSYGPDRNPDGSDVTGPGGNPAG